MDITESAIDPAAELERILFRTGIVKAHGRKSSVYHLITGITYLQLLMSGLTSWIYPFENHSFDDKIESIQCAISFVHLVGKIANLKARRETFWKLINDSRELWRELSLVQGNRHILLDESVFLKKAQKAITVLALWPVPLSIMLAIGRNLGLRSEERELIYREWDPFRDTLGEDFYWTRAAYQVVVMTYALYLFVAVYCALLVPCLIAAAFMKCLVRMLESERLDVKACILLHQRILRFIAGINSLFAGQMFLDMILSALYISFRSYQLIQMVNSNDPRALGTVFFLSVCFGGPLIVCLSGHIVTDMMVQGTYSYITLLTGK